MELTTSSDLDQRPEKHTPKIRIGLRGKLILLLITLSCGTLALFMSVTIHEYRDDKQLFILDSSLSVVKAESELVQKQCDALVSRMKSFLPALDVSSSAHQEAQTEFDGQNEFSAVYSYKKAESGWTVVSSLKKPAINEQVIPATGFLDRTVALGFALSSPVASAGGANGGDRHWIAVRLHARNSSGDYVVAGLVDNQFVKRSSSLVTENMVIATAEGEIVDSSRSTYLKTLGDKTSPLLKGVIAELKSSSGVKDLELAGGAHALIAVAPIEVGDLYLAALTPSELAFAAAKMMAVKGMLFFLALAFFVTGLSIILGSKVTAALNRLVGATEEISQGNFDIQLDPSSQDEVGMLTANFNSMVSEIKRLIHETIEKSRMESELRTARTVQANLFPQNNFRSGWAQICGYYEPASECSGDWWYYFEINNRLYVFIGDATGHGVAAALVTSAAKSASNLMFEFPELPLEVLARFFNRAIYETSHGQVAMTFIIGCLDQITGRFEYINASHEAPFVLRNTAKPVDRKQIEILGASPGQRMGENENSQYLASSIQLAAGDRLFFFTDGVTDIADPAGNLFGERRLTATITKAFNKSESIEATVSGLATQFSEFRNGTPLADDCTYFVLEYKAAA
jgi:sigma-B regulation protein RsbU (phosphoserine phosphatase)